MDAWICIERSSRPPKAPPTPARATPDLLGRKVEAGGDLAAVGVEPLRRHEQVDAAVLRRDREARLGAEEGLVLHADLVVAADDDVGLGHRVDVAVDHADVLEHVAAGMEQRRLGRRLDRAVHVGDGLRGLVVDLDEGGGAARGLGMVGGDDRDRLALVADAVAGEDGLVGDLEPVGLRAGHVLVREDREHAGDGERLREVERADARGRVRAAQRGAPQRAVAPEVGAVGELAADLERAVRPPGVGADAVPDARLRDDAHRARAAIRTASRIFS